MGRARARRHVGIRVTHATRSELTAQLAVLLAGCVAEEVVFGDRTTGAEKDLSRATALARKMVRAYGMSEAAGLRTFRPGRRAGRHRWSQACPVELDRLPAGAARDSAPAPAERSSGAAAGSALRRRPAKPRARSTGVPSA